MSDEEAEQQIAELLEVMDSKMFSIRYTVAQLVELVSSRALPPGVPGRQEEHASG